jgi:MFS family permease
MSNRWLILFVLFFARTTMAFQFQAVAALSPVIIENYLVSLVDIGLLIGLYLGPGVIVAIPGGAIAARFGDRRVVVISLLMMLVGAVIMGFGGGWGLLLAGRVLAGVGGVVINIVMTKMLLDWFAGREIATAMGIFISSWPVGIALALLILPNIAVIGGLGMAWGAVTAAVVLSLAMFVLVYRAPVSATSSTAGITFSKLPALALLLAAGLWALYNTALAMVFGFGPILLTERGLPLPAASSMVSIFIIFVGVGIPIGGFLADKTGKRDGVIFVSLVVSAVLLPVLLYLPLSVVSLIFAVTGLVFGLGAGPIMTLPSQILRPEARALGMGVFFAVYNGLMMVAPTVAGGMADRAGKADVAFVLGAAMLVVCIAALAGFRRVTVTPAA